MGADQPGDTDSTRPASVVATGPGLITSVLGMAESVAGAHDIESAPPHRRDANANRHGGHERSATRCWLRLSADRPHAVLTVAPALRAPLP